MRMSAWILMGLMRVLLATAISIVVLRATLDRRA
jgi:hypothetical protein